jgi:hypothetical protein
MAAVLISLIVFTGMAEYGVSSMTSNLEVALDYSGVRNGQTATVLAVRVSQVDSGACLIDFSQVLPLLLLFRFMFRMSARVSLHSQMAQILSDFNDNRMYKFDDPRSTLNPH